MKPKLLLLGGTYFLGRTFTLLASKEYELHLINRGNNPLSTEGITEYHLDRHDGAALSKLPGDHYAAVVDFCAYSEGDIKEIFDHLNASFDQYIFISTVDVYKRGLDALLDETAPFEKRDFGGQAGAYIKGKVALESELASCCKEKNIPYTSIRPAFIYGPGNYAPREGIYFNWIAQAGQIIHPSDSDGFFQMVYVEDVARAILKTCADPKAFNEAFNICPDSLITYDGFADALKAAMQTDFEKVPLTVKEINERGIPLPFPLTKEESNRYSSKKADRIFSIQYTDLSEGLLYSVHS